MGQKIDRGIRLVAIARDPFNLAVQFLLKVNISLQWHSIYPTSLHQHLKSPRLYLHQLEERIPTDLSQFTQHFAMAHEANHHDDPGKLSSGVKSNVGENRDGKNNEASLPLRELSIHIDSR